MERDLELVSLKSDVESREHPQLRGGVMKSLHVKEIESCQCTTTATKSFLLRQYGPLPFAKGLPPITRWPGLILESLKSNVRSGATVSLVSLPLSISLAIASSATPNQGMITAAWAGLIFSMFGGSDFNIVGPTGALSGILSTYSIRYESPAILSLLAILSAILLFILLAFRLDKYLMFIPSAVIHGFTVGVALIIGLNQLAFALGVKGSRLGLPKPREEFYLNIFEVFKHSDTTNPFSVAIFLITFSFDLQSLFLLLRKWPKVPWAVVIAIIGIVLGWLTYNEYIPMPAGYRVLSLKDKFGNIKADFFTPTKFKEEWLELSSLLELVGSAFNIMLVAALETLISAKIASDWTNVPFHQTWEIAGLALANILSGLFGGIPATAALARTSLNVKSGATSRVSGIINGLLIFAISYIVLGFFSYLLQPVVAGILVVVAARMVEIEPILQMIQYDRGALAVCIVTMLTCIVDNPTDAIIVGSVISLLRLAKYVASLEGHDDIKVDGHEVFVPIQLNMSDDEDETNVEDSDGMAFGLMSPKAHVVLFTISGDMTYLNSRSWFARAKQISSQAKYVVASFRHLGYVDLDGALAIGDIIAVLEKRRQPNRILVSGISHALERYEVLRRAKWVSDKDDQGLLFPHYSDALHYVKSIEQEDSAFVIVNADTSDEDELASSISADDSHSK